MHDYSPREFYLERKLSANSTAEALAKSLQVFQEGSNLERIERKSNFRFSQMEKIEELASRLPKGDVEIAPYEPLEVFPNTLIDVPSGKQNLAIVQARKRSSKETFWITLGLFEEARRAMQARRKHAEKLLSEGKAFPKQAERSPMAPGYMSHAEIDEIVGPPSVESLTKPSLREGTNSSNSPYLPKR